MYLKVVVFEKLINSLSKNSSFSFSKEYLYNETKLSLYNSKTFCASSFLNILKFISSMFSVKKLMFETSQRASVEQNLKPQPLINKSIKSLLLSSTAIIKVSTDTTDILFNDLTLKNPYFNVNKNEILYYYGDAVNGDTVLCYVYYGNKLGYIDKSCLNPFTITPNLDPYDTETPDISNPIETPDINSTQKINLGENLQIIIIVGISIVSISVVYFLFKPQKFKTSEEQNEFTSE
jgi:hypothetical protein